MGHHGWHGGLASVLAALPEDSGSVLEPHGRSQLFVAPDPGAPVLSASSCSKGTRLVAGAQTRMQWHNRTHKIKIKKHL